MSDLFFQTMERLTPALRRGDIDACERDVVATLQTLPQSPFHIAIDLAISNEPVDAASHFDRFFHQEGARFKIAAAYTEMNGFDINPDRWYCDLFAYNSYGGHDDYDWLSDWQSESFDEFEINGLESLQGVYASEAFQNPQFEDSSFMASALVVVKFQQFMRSAAKQMKQHRFPLLVTAHDFDFIAELGPSA